MILQKCTRDLVTYSCTVRSQKKGNRSRSSRKNYKNLHKVHKDLGNEETFTLHFKKEKRFFCSEEGFAQDCRTERRCGIVNIGCAVAKEVTEMRVLPPWKKDPPPHGVASQKCHAVADKVTEIGPLRVPIHFRYQFSSL